MIKAVIFDCFGVLTVDSWREFRAPLNGQNKLKAQELTRAYDMGHIDENQLASEVADMLNVPAEVALAANKPKNQKNIALLAYIQQLRARGLKIGMLSNINSNWDREAFLSSEEQALFDDFVLSYDI